VITALEDVMAEDLNGLIERIQEEGVRAAEDKARAIEADAKAKAEKILAEAKSRSAAIVENGKLEVARSEENSKIELKQAGRDLMIALRKEIHGMLEKVIALHVREALSPAEMERLILSIIKDYKCGGKENIVVTIKKDDMDKLDKALISELGEKAKHGITLRPSDEIRGGFVISYDSGKSHFDFTDKALAEYISSSLKPRLIEILK
jgi:vacuolar-type H+-ATPase subunit E/Vma4